MKRISHVIAFILSTMLGYSQSIEQTAYFESNKYEIADSAMLDIIKILNSTTIYDVEIFGYCDSVGSKAYNYALSLKRVNAIKKLLVANGLQSSQIKSTIGYGEDKFSIQDKSLDELFQNRKSVIRFNIDKKPEPVHSAKSITSSLLKKEDFKTGNSINLKQLFFIPSTHRLVPSSLPYLDTLVMFLNEHSTIEIQIHGHVCCTTYHLDGDDSETGLSNLSEARAMSVYQYLIDHGISPKRLSYKGFGGSKKINQDETTEINRRANRRVEIRITKE